MELKEFRYDSDIEIEYVKEYVKVIKPIVETLDILQDDILL